MKKAYKGFNEDLTCRGFQYKKGETYETETADLCSSGFHACEDPLDCFTYYSPNSSQFREVVLDGISDQRENDSKICAKTITIGARLNFSDMVKAAFDIRWSKTSLEPGSLATGYQGAASATGYQGAASATGTKGAASATGDQGAASATGYQGAASATGYQGAASATGDQGAASATGTKGAASATGYQGAASATGYQGAASATGKEGIASALGYEGRAKGALGCWIILAERGLWNGETYPIRDIKAFKVDGETILPDTWYVLRNGNPVKLEDHV